MYVAITINTDQNETTSTHEIEHINDLPPIISEEIMAVGAGWTSACVTITFTNPAILPEGVVRLDISDPAKMHNTLKKILGE